MFWAWSVQLLMRNSNFPKWRLHHRKAASWREGSHLFINFWYNLYRCSGSSQTPNPFFLSANAFFEKNDAHFETSTNENEWRQKIHLSLKSCRTDPGYHCANFFWLLFTYITLTQNKLLLNFLYAARVFRMCLFWTLLQKQEGGVTSNEHSLGIGTIMELGI